MFHLEATYGHVVGEVCSPDQPKKQRFKPRPVEDLVDLDVGVDQVFDRLRERELGQRVDLRQLCHRLRLDRLGSLLLHFRRLDPGSNQDLRLEGVGKGVV